MYSIVKNPINKKTLFLLWTLTILSAYFGPTLGVGSIFAFRFLLVIYLSYLAIFILINKDVKLYVDENVKGLVLFFFLWFVYAAITIIWAESKIDVLKELVYIFSANFIIVSSLYHLNTIKKLRILLSLSFIIYLIISVIGLWEVITGNHLSRSAAGNYPYWKRYIPTSIFVNPNDFATYITLFISYIIFLFKIYRNNLVKIVLMIGIILGIYLIIQTNSRANIISIVIIFLLYFLFANYKSKIKIFTIGTIITTMLIIFNFNVLSNFYYEVEGQVQTVNVENGSIQVRINLIKNGLLMLEDSLLMGVGAGNIETNMPQYFSINPTSDIANMHNFFIELLSSYGILFFILFFIFYLKLFKESIGIILDLKKERNEYNELSKVILIQLLVFLVASISSSSIIGDKYIWINFAIILSFINIVRLKNLKLR